jgi:class 3 adenylate cyclase/HAMP domain-containing protein
MRTPIPPLDPLVRFVARRSLSLHAKLLAGFLLIALLFVATAALGLVLTQRAGAQSGRIAALTDRILAAARMEYAITAGMHFRAMHLLTSDPANDQKLIKSRQDFAKLEGALEATADAREAEVFRKIQEANLRFGVAAQQVDSLAHADRTAEAMKLHLDQEHPISHELEGLSRDLIRLASDRRNQTLDEVMTTNRTSLLLISTAAVASVFLALLLGYVLAWSIVGPVSELDEHLGRIARGQFEREIAIPNRDELHTLAEKANDMMRALAQARAQLVGEHEAVKLQAAGLEDLNRELETRVRAQVEEIERTRRLSSYLAPQVVHAITSGQTSYAMGNARKQLTIVFADIRGFTDFSDVAEPEEVIGFLNAYLSRMTDLVFKFEGTLDKFLGDGVLVFFNDPLPQPDHARRAVQMALEMREQAREMRREWHLDTPFDIGVGISTGFVTVGTIGSEHRMEYTVVGTQVNLAARLVAVAEPGQIIVSQRTLELVRDMIDVEPMGPLTVKGFKRPVTAYNVLGMKGVRRADAGEGSR